MEKMALKAPRDYGFPPLPVVKQLHARVPSHSSERPSLKLVDADTPTSEPLPSIPHLHEGLVHVVKGLPVLAVVKRGHANDLFLLVDDWHGKHIFNHPSRLIQRLFLQENGKAFMMHR